ncbi:phosphoribosylformylglycinamidine synthase [Oceanihabitans sp. IOP_32]|uniref:HAEPLYID family protein n=1 Tax=Oceanihabitans sp. IOP_32 TaxID=2529032 RepID=UPI001293563F|nr:HAEPLYID family protein [Oceanihabitans sp. IOP_32]QFZ55090.1 phosphoribosylformylglycinamidine synthase [Oceanihabitans sp. IOP_32]
MKKELTLIGVLFLSFANYAQTTIEPETPEKVHHIEPLYIDLVRDLGARKGEKELNLGANFANTTSYSAYEVLAEYEFAPINRLGLEIETGFSFYDGYTNSNTTPKNKMDALKLSGQYSFYVSPKHKTTLALGYAQIFEFTDFSSYDTSTFVKEIVYSPFFVAAKRWGDNFHTLIFTGPDLKHELNTDFTDVDWQFNTSFHYEIPNSSHFIGIEFNKELVQDDFEMTMRPQAKLQINETLALGIVTGFPLTENEEKFSSFFRVIYEL